MGGTDICSERLAVRQERTQDVTRDLPSTECGTPRTARLPTNAGKSVRLPDRSLFTLWHVQILSLAGASWAHLAENRLGSPFCIVYRTLEAVLGIGCHLRRGRRVATVARKKK